MLNSSTVSSLNLHYSLESWMGEESTQSRSSHTGTWAPRQNIILLVLMTLLCLLLVIFRHCFFSSRFLSPVSYGDWPQKREHLWVCLVDLCWPSRIPNSSTMALRAVLCTTQFCIPFQAGCSVLEYRNQVSAKCGEDLLSCEWRVAEMSASPFAGAGGERDRFQQRE